MRVRTALSDAVDAALQQRRREGVTQRMLGRSIAEAEDARRRSLRRPRMSEETLRTAAAQWEKRLSSWRHATALPMSADRLLLAMTVVAPDSSSTSWLDLWNTAIEADRRRSSPALSLASVPGPDDVIPADVTPPAVATTPASHDGRPDDRPPVAHRRNRRAVLAVTAALVLVSLTAAGTLLRPPVGPAHVTRPRQADGSHAPTSPTVSYTLPDACYWQDGPSLGVTPTAEQEASVEVHGLSRDDDQHAAGFRMRSGTDSTGRELYLRVLLNGQRWRVELQDSRDETVLPWGDGPFPVTGDGLLDVRITAQNRVSITYAGVRVTDWPMPPGATMFTGREILPSIWECTPHRVTLAGFRSNAIPPGNPASPSDHPSARQG